MRDDAVIPLISIHYFVSNWPLKSVFRQRSCLLAFAAAAWKKVEWWLMEHCGLMHFDIDLNFDWFLSFFRDRFLDILTFTLFYCDNLPHNNVEILTFYPLLVWQFTLFYNDKTLHLQFTHCPWANFKPQQNKLVDYCTLCIDAFHERAISCWSLSGFLRGWESWGLLLLFKMCNKKFGGAYQSQSPIVTENINCIK